MIKLTCIYDHEILFRVNTNFIPRKGEQVEHKNELYKVVNVTYDLHSNSVEVIVEKD